MPTLHIYCDFREPSLARAAQEARRLDKYSLRIIQVRTGNLAKMFHQMTSIMSEDDLALVALLHTYPDQLLESGEIISRTPLDLRQRITLCCSSYSQAMREWTEKWNLRYETNQYEASRSVPPQPCKPAHRTTLQERRWIQYRLMRALIAGESTVDVYNQIIQTLRQGRPSEAELNRASRFHERGEPDMAGGNYSEARRKSPNAMDRLRNRAVEVGRSGLNTLIIGETGTGKESLAWYLHDFSTRLDRPFLALNCAFLEGERLESELFGHEQGAFTDAKKAKPGLVEEADGGTLFLDELPEMAPRVQAKLLRFLQDGTYTRLGGNRTFRADVRVISAAQPGHLGKLRPDLYYRIADVELHTVSLRELEQRDIVNIGCNLAYRLMWKPIMQEDGAAVLTPDIIRTVWHRLALPNNAAVLANYPWPGNMRELSTMIKRLVFLGDDIFQELKEKNSSPLALEKAPIAAYDEEWRQFLSPVSSLDDIESRHLRLKSLQSAYLRHLVASLGGRDNIQPTKLAQALGCTYNTLVNSLDATLQNR